MMEDTATTLARRYGETIRGLRRAMTWEEACAALDINPAHKRNINVAIMWAAWQVDKEMAKVKPLGEILTDEE